MLPIIPAKVPSILIAPSVPLGTRRNVVIRYVLRPYALPSSEPNVSDNFVAIDAT